MYHREAVCSRRWLGNEPGSVEHNAASFIEGWDAKVLGGCWGVVDIRAAGEVMKRNGLDKRVVQFVWSKTSSLVIYLNR